MEALRRFVVGSLVLGSLALAKPIAESQMLSTVEGCIATIHVYAPDVYRLEIAQILHKAVVRRGVKLYLFVPHQTVFRPSRSSLVMGLAWAGAELYLVDSSEGRAVLVCDSQKVLVGEGLFRGGEAVVHSYRFEEAEFKSLAGWMRRLIAMGQPFDVRKNIELFARWR